MMDCRIAQWNCQSVLKKIPEMQVKLANFGILILSETWLRPTDRILFRGYDMTLDTVEMIDGEEVLLFLLKMVLNILPLRMFTIVMADSKCVVWRLILMTNHLIYFPFTDHLMSIFPRRNDQISLTRCLSMIRC